MPRFSYFREARTIRVADIGQLEPATPMSTAWRRLRVAVLIGALLLSAILTLNWWLQIGHRTPDWAVIAEVPGRLDRQSLYAPPDYNWRWSPVAAWVMVPIVMVGYWPFVAFHFAVLPLLGRRLALTTLCTWPFWADALVSSTMTFSFVAGILALRGSRTAGVVYIALAMMAPRPILAPMAAYLIWRYERLRIPAAVVVVVHTVLTSASGYGTEFARTLIDAAGDVNNAWNFSPTRLIGYWWLVVGIPAGIWLTQRGRVGLASLALSPYLLPHYFLVALWDVRFDFHARGHDRLRFSARRRSDVQRVAEIASDADE